MKDKEIEKMKIFRSRDQFYKTRLVGSVNFDTCHNPVTLSFMRTWWALTLQM